MHLDTSFDYDNFLSKYLAYMKILNQKGENLKTILIFVTLKHIPFAAQQYEG